MRQIIVLSFFLLATACAPGLSPEEINLANEVGMDTLTATTIRAHGNALERLMGLNDDWESVEARGVVLRTSKNRGEAVLAKLRKELKGTGHAVYLLDQGFGFGPDSIAVLDDSDPYEYLRIVRINGINYDIDHPEVIERYRRWDDLYGLNLIGAGMDWLHAEFTTPPSDWNAFAREVYEFCPDVVDQGAGSVEALSLELQSLNGVYLWWD